MAQLTISTYEALGPLSVEVLGARGRRIGRRITLSSTDNQAVVDDVAPGDYTVIATRPSGEQLVSSALVEDKGGYAVIEMAGRSPREFMIDAARLGLAYAPPVEGDRTFQETAIASPFAANTAARSIGALATSRPALGDAGNAAGAISKIFLGLHPRSDQFRLTWWSQIDGRWRRGGNFPLFIVGSGDFLQVRLQSPDPVALGLLDEAGFGPIVIVPPFRLGTDVNFLADGVMMVRSANRVMNPSAVRVPVALAVPHQPDIADLLVGLAAPSLPDATYILTHDRGRTTDTALDILLHKYDDPAAAVLGALFLARFSPTELPPAWLRNLHDILPTVGDTSLLIAWARSVQGQADHRPEVPIDDLLRTATRARCMLFNWSRYQLNRMAQTYGPYARARQELVETPRHPRTGDYLDFAADAGGLEAFWGTSPVNPGWSDLERRRMPSPHGIDMTIGDGGFSDVSFRDNL